MAAQILPPPAGLDHDLRNVLLGYFQALQELRQPTQPSLAVVAPDAATLASRALPDDWRGGYAIVADVPCLAISVETSPGTWQWLRADGAAL